MSKKADRDNKKYQNYCLECETRNCYYRHLGAKQEKCLEIDHAKQIKISDEQIGLIDKANLATKKAMQKKPEENFALNWLVGFIKNFFIDKGPIGIASCLGSVPKAKVVINALEKEGVETILVTCKIGGLTINNVDKQGNPYKHPGCNPIGQANIFNEMNVPVVVLVGLCIGHDMLFIKHCKSYVIPFMTKAPISYGTI